MKTALKITAAVALVLGGLLTGACGGMAAGEPTADNLGICDSEWMTKQIKKGAHLYSGDGPLSIRELDDIWQFDPQSKSEFEEELERIRSVKDQTALDQLKVERRNRLHNEATKAGELRCFATAWYRADRDSRDMGSRPIGLDTALDERRKN